MKRVKVMLAAVVILASCNNAATETKEKKDSTPVKTEEAFVPVDSATAAKNWQAYMTPGKVHTMMSSWDGVWATETSTWMEPGKPPMQSTGTMTNKMILNGLYQESVYKGNMMGMPFEGRGTMGYDNAKKVFVSTWIDNMGSGIMKMEGPWDDATKSITLTGIGVDAATGKNCNMREVYKVVDAKTHAMEMYGPSPVDGKETKMMEIKFTKK